MTMIRKWLTGLTAAVTLYWLASGWAEASGTSLGVLAQVTVKQSGGRNWVVEGLVIVALIGAALFAICKSSRRV
jgi:hypothetical protein